MKKINAKFTAAAAALMITAGTRVCGTDRTGRRCHDVRAVLPRI